MTEYQRIFNTTFVTGKTVRNTNGKHGVIEFSNPITQKVYVRWADGTKSYININKEHIYIV